MESIDIKGKSYIMVNERIMYFKNNYDGSIVTELLSNENGMCIFKAEVFIEGILRATGHAYEKEGSTFINKTSYIENCETSAVGRALGILGIGIETSIASAEEVQNAIKQQESSKPTKTSADYEKEVDKLKSIASINAWVTEKDGELTKNLSKTEYNKIVRYVKHVRELIRESNGINADAKGDLPI